MVQQPGCPNLYWALTDLPCPLVDLRKGVQGDRTLVAAELRPLRDDAPMTEAELEAFVSRLSGLISFAREQAGQPPRSLRARLQARVKDPERVARRPPPPGRGGFATELVKTFPPLQVILLDEKRDYEIQRDERIKLLALPLWQIDSLAGGEERASDGDGLFADLLPQIIKLRRAQGQLEQQIALLRHVEALRLYAAEHDGKLPAKLSDISVPLPVDPVTGKPFVYAVEGTTAHIRGGSRRARRERQGVHPLRGDALRSDSCPDLVNTEVYHGRDVPDAGPDRPRRGLAAVAALRRRPLGTQVGCPSLSPCGLRRQPRRPRSRPSASARRHARSAARGRPLPRRSWRP